MDIVLGKLLRFSLEKVDVFGKASDFNQKTCSSRMTPKVLGKEQGLVERLQILIRKHVLAA